MNMLNHSKILLVIMCLLSWQALADKRQSNVKKCIKLVKKDCGNQDLEKCMTSKPKKAKNISECLVYLVESNQLKKVEPSSLNSSLKKYLSSSTMSKDQSTCHEMSQMICRNSEDYQQCMKNRASKMPSYCQKVDDSGMKRSKELLTNNKELARCTDSLAKSCKFVMPVEKVKPDPKKYQAAMKSYQSCLQAQIQKKKECGNLTNGKDRKGVTQLIQ